jgi:hypothetical protein
MDFVFLQAQFVLPLINETANLSKLDELSQVRPASAPQAACSSRPTKREKKREKPYRGDSGEFLLNVRGAG